MKHVNNRAPATPRTKIVLTFFFFEIFNFLNAYINNFLIYGPVSVEPFTRSLHSPRLFDEAYITII